MIDTKTKLMGLLGKPLGQSYSALMHTEAYAKLGLNCLYLPIESDADALGDIVGGIRQMNFVGFNVTKPHKVEIIKHLDGMDDLARTIGAVNTVKKEDGKLIGYNTDGTGFVDSLENELGLRVKNHSFFIIGAGGAARAVAITLAFQGASQVLISDLYPELAQELADHINRNIRPCGAAVEGSEEGFRAAIAACDCLINASGVGMYPHPERTPVDKSWLNPGMAVCDLTYNPDKTRLLLDAQELGCPTLNGLGMLINQGARAFEIWLDMPAPLAEMRAVTLAQVRAES